MSRQQEDKDSIFFTQELVSKGINLEHDYLLLPTVRGPSPTASAVAKHMKSGWMSSDLRRCLWRAGALVSVHLGCILCSSSVTYGPIVVDRYCCELIFIT